MIYVLEDDESIRELIIYTLNGQSMEARGFAAPSEFWAAMSEKTPSLVLLDIMLPEEDGFSILQKLRAAPATKRLPIIMLTAKGSEYDIVRGLDIGADDYIPKPFRMMELLSRIRALLRRSGGDNGKMEEYRVGNLYVNPIKHVVEVDGKEVILTLKEFELLSLLISRQGIVLPAPSCSMKSGATVSTAKAGRWMSTFVPCGRSWVRPEATLKRCAASAIK